MEASDVARAIEATMAIVETFDLPAERAIVLQNSNKLALRLLPCDVFARVAHMGHEYARFEVGLAQQLTAAGCPLAALEPRVEPRGYHRDDFEVTFWTYYEPSTPPVSPAAYADALGRLHAGMRTLDVPTPHFTDRVAHAEDLVASRVHTPKLTDADRHLLADTLQRLRRTIVDRATVEQVVHGEPHPGNLLSTATGALFIDLETCCRGPIEFDLAHVPRAVSGAYPGVDPALLSDCRHLVLAMVAVWRWELGDQFPNGTQFGRQLLSVLRTDPPWPTLDELFGRPDAP